MRSSGILLHPTSLPGGHGIGDLGDAAFRFADFLADSGHGIWQLLPLGPPAVADSPYKCLSSMAGNPLLISLDLLMRDGFLSSADLGEAPAFPAEAVDFGAVSAFKWKLLRKAARVFFAQGSPARLHEFEQFCAESGFWLDHYAEFMALRDQNGCEIWTQWRRKRDADPEQLRQHKYIQFEFYRQWRALRKYCHDRGIRILGDLPIFVALDSADVWGYPELFDLNEQGWPRTVAGVPPDYFSATGQLWDNPLYRWDAMERAGYRWWIDRIRCMLDQVDLIRIDHFRGFEKYYEIPVGAKTAIDGRWVEGPGDRFFEALSAVFGKLPFIAEDLGFITPEVHALRDRWGLPGMRVLQFAFGDGSSSNPFQPHNYVRNCVVYTGTHDNDTTAGWFRGTSAEDRRTEELKRAEREYVLRYLNSDGAEIHWDLIRAAISSVADTAVYPLQDVLGLGSEARMNLPSCPAGNWRWRFQAEQLQPGLGDRLRELNRLYGRLKQ
jgi:4-alpha-glucanotransferase